jgi:hypothetical protein
MSYDAGLLDRCSPEERQQVYDMLAYLKEAATRGRIPEGTVQNLLNKQSANVREVFSTFDKLLETPRIAPFDPKLSAEDHIELLGMDKDSTLTIKRGLDDAYIASELTDRLGGSDATRDPEPITMRDQLGAAVDLHSGVEE